MKFILIDEVRQVPISRIIATWCSGKFPDNLIYHVQLDDETVHTIHERDREELIDKEGYSDVIPAFPGFTALRICPSDDGSPSIILEAPVVGWRLNTDLNAPALAVTPDEALNDPYCSHIVIEEPSGIIRRAHDNVWPSRQVWLDEEL